MVYGGNDVLVGGAAAQVPGHPFADLALVEIGPTREAACWSGHRTRVRPVDLGQHADGGNDLARRAIGALERVLFDESALHRMKCAVAPGQSLDRRYLSIAHGERERQAGKHVAAVDQHRAGTACPVVASLFRSGEADTLSQRIEQRRPRFDGDVVRSAIDVEPQRHRPQRIAGGEHRRGGRRAGWRIDQTSSELRRKKHDAAPSVRSSGEQRVNSSRSVSRQVAASRRRFQRRNIHTVQIQSLELSHALRWSFAFWRNDAVEARSMTRAAEALGLTPSDVDRAIARLETRVGVRLLERPAR
jgi:Bacterial regulatory helix-turn-helix protein, lysR family